MPRPKGSKNIKSVNQENIANNDSSYSLTIKVLGKLWNFTGGSFDELLSKLNIRGGRGISVWKLNNGDREIVKIMQPIQTLRFFNSAGTAKDIITKNIKAIFWRAMMPPSIYDYIKSEEARFESEEIQLGDNWNWSFRKHVQMLFHLVNGVFFKGQNDWTRALKNIMLPMINLANWMEDIEMKEIVFFTENENDRFKSFLIKKYHDDVFVKKYDLDTFIDEITNSDNIYGVVLVQDTGEPKPEIISLKSIAFCDQNDMLSGVIGFKKHFSPTALRAMSERGWGNEKNGADITIEELITVATGKKDVLGSSNSKQNESTSKNIDVYILMGNMPSHYLNDDDNFEDFSEQVQIRAFYYDKDNKKQGVCLYRKEEPESRLMVHTSEKVEDRAIGRGIGEPLIHPQIWTNFLTIHKTKMLEAASKIPLYTDDDTYTQNKIQDMENLEITTIEEGKRIYQVPTAAPANLQVISNEIDVWYQQAQLSSSAFDPVLGEQPVSGTTFRGQNQIVQQGKGFHEKRKGQRAKFIELIYRKIIIPKMVKEITSGHKFLATLSADEMSWLGDALAQNYANNKIKEAILNGEIPASSFDTYKQQYIAEFARKGNTHMLEILKDEFKDMEINIGINVANKQKDLAGLSDKLLSIIQFAFQNPEQFKATMQIPGMGKAFNDILEYSGINPVSFASIANMPVQQPVASPIQQQQLSAQPVAQNG